MVVVTVTGVRRSGAQLLGQVAELGQPDIGHAEQPGAFRREGHAAKAAHQQRHAQVRLQRPNLAADGGLGHMQVLGGQRDAHAPPHGHEASDQIKRGSLASGYDIPKTHV